MGQPTNCHCTLRSLCIKYIVYLLANITCITPPEVRGMHSRLFKWSIQLDCTMQDALDVAHVCLATSACLPQDMFVLCCRVMLLAVPQCCLHGHMTYPRLDVLPKLLH